MPDPTPDQLRKEMAQNVNHAFNDGITEGIVIGADPIPVEGVQPEPSPLGTTPSGSVEPKEEAPTAPPEPKEEPKGDLIFGKYTSLEEAQKGYYHLNNKLSSTLRDHESAVKERDDLRAQMATVANPQEPTMVPGSSPGSRDRVNPAARVDWKSNPHIVRVSEETGIDPGALGNIAQAAYETAHTQLRDEIREEIKQEISPFQAAAEAETYMRTTYPEAYNHIQEIQNFVATDPSTQRVVNNLLNMGDHKGAYETAWKNYLMETGIGAQSNMRVNAEIAEEERTEARKAAGLPQSPGTPGHAETGSQSMAKEQFDELLERAKAGDTEAQKLLRRHAYGRMLPPALRTWETGG
jgi:hypothetical protein